MTDLIRSLVFRSEIPEFEGRLCPDDFLDWLRTVDRNLIFVDHTKIISRLALKVEKQLLAKQKTTTRFGSSSRAPQSATGPVRVGPIKAEPPALIGVSPTPTTSSLRCFKCQGIGHLKRDCPNKQVLTLIDEVDPLYDTEDEAETEVVYPDRGELLVTRRLLNTAVLDQDDDTTWLRTNIFRTQCTAKGKVCTVIIDGGSCENMVSTTMVEKLGLPIQNHPDPYQLTWPKLARDVQKVINRCRVCHIAKTQHTNQGLYTPLPTPEGPWEDVSIDFVLGLPLTQRKKDSIMVARLYFAEIVRLHGVPRSITSDRDVKFVSHFWRTLWKRLGAKLNFSSSHHPQTDGQTEVTNRKRNPFTPLDLAPMVDDGSVSAEGDERARQIKELHAQVREQIIKHNLQYQTRANKHRKQVLFEEGDLVWIHLRHARFPQGRFGKLNPRADGPFRILKKINDNAYKVELPGHYGVSSTFNVADLSPYTPDADFDDDSGSSRFFRGEAMIRIQDEVPLSPTQAEPTESG
ncbi:RNA-directed DNA polymerase [Tanacetum coccineum]